MAKKRQERQEFRYYEMPKGCYVLALLGDQWKRRYGKKGDNLHFHNFMEIGYCYNGGGTLALRDKAYAYFSNTFSIIPPNCPHNTVSDEDSISTWEYLFVDVEKFLGDMYPDKPRYAKEMLERIYQKMHFLSHDGNPVLGNLIQELIREQRYHEAYYQEKTKGILLEILIEIVRMTPEPDFYINERHENEQTKISNALHYIGKHYNENIKVELLAEKCNLSEPHFRRIFRSVMRMSPIEYVNWVRIQTACNLLERSDDTIEEIAVKTGFVSMSTFNRNFKKIMHLTPSQWRNRPEVLTPNLNRYYVSTTEK